jgi:AbrB family looped-hinge helix DNA binding protein
MNTNIRYEVITQIDSETGDTIVPIPQEILDQMGWKEGDSIEFTDNGDGTLILTKHQR